MPARSRPSIDTAAIENYLTMRRMQEDVERLETLDVSGKTQAAPDAGPEAPVVEPEADRSDAEMAPPPAEPAEVAPIEGPKPRAESEARRQAEAPVSDA